MLLTKNEEDKMINSYRLKRINDYVNKRCVEFVNCKNLEVINYEHFKQLLYDLRASLRSYPDMEFITNYTKEIKTKFYKLHSSYGMGGFIKEIKISPEEAEKLKSELIEWDGEFYPKIIFDYSKDKEIERLNNIINELEEYMIGKDIYKILLYKLRDLKESEKE